LNLTIGITINKLYFSLSELTSISRRNGLKKLHTWSLEELQGIIPHVFLPRRLPSSVQDDLEEIELNILRIIESTTEELNCTLFPNTFPRTEKLFQKWVLVQQKLSSCFTAAAISEDIQSLEAGEMLAMYVRAQNSGLLLSIPTIEEDSLKSCNQTVIFSSFSAAAPMKSVISAPGDLTVLVPEASYIIPKSALLQSKDFLEQLGYLTQTQIYMTLSQASKAGNRFSEVRDVADPMFITDWAMAVLSNEESQICKAFPRIRKKVRDDVNWCQSSLPFRRSGLWLTAKVALQISLIRELGPEYGPVVYKALMIKSCILFL